jgi:hypothetical protein
MNCFFLLKISEIIVQGRGFCLFVIFSYIFMASEPGPGISKILVWYYMNFLKLLNLVFEKVNIFGSTSSPGVVVFVWI